MRKIFSEFLIWGKILDSEDLEIKYNTQASHLQMSPHTENFFPVTQLLLLLLLLMFLC